MKLALGFVAGVCHSGIGKLLATATFYFSVRRLPFHMCTETYGKAVVIHPETVTLIYDWPDCRSEGAWF
jgi:hypothetical protein